MTKQLDRDRELLETWKQKMRLTDFPTEEIRDQFLKDHKELIEEYFLIYW